MAYPMPLIYDDERVERMDYEYMKSMYPKMAKTILPYVEEECDHYENPGSMIYDEYPDKLQLRLMCRRIFENICRQEKTMMEYGEDSGEKKAWLWDFIEVMLYQELYKRRCDNRRMCRRFY